MEGDTADVPAPSSLWSLAVGLLGGLVQLRRRVLQFAPSLA